MGSVFDFSRIQIYISYMSIDRVMADRICQIFSRESFQVTDVEHSPLRASSTAVGDDVLRQADIALLIVSPEAIAARHILDEAEVAHQHDLPVVPVVVDDMRGAARFTEIFDARNQDEATLQAAILWHVCKALTSRWCHERGFTTAQQRATFQRDTLRAMRTQLIEQSQRRLRAARALRKRQTAELIKEAQRRRDEERRQNTAQLRRNKTERLITGLLSRLGS